MIPLELGHCSVLICMKIYIVPVPVVLQKEPVCSGSVNKFQSRFAFLGSDLPLVRLIILISYLLISYLAVYTNTLQLNQISSAIRFLSVVWSLSNASTVLTIQSFYSC